MFDMFRTNNGYRKLLCKYLGTGRVSKNGNPELSNLKNGITEYFYAKIGNPDTPFTPPQRTITTNKPRAEQFSKSTLIVGGGRYL